MFFDIASPKDFSKIHERLDDDDGDVETLEVWQMNEAQKKSSSIETKPAKPES